MKSPPDYINFDSLFHKLVLLLLNLTLICLIYDKDCTIDVAFSLSLIKNRY